MITAILRWGAVRPPKKLFVTGPGNRAFFFGDQRRTVVVAAAAAVGAVVVCGTLYAYYSGRIADERAEAARAETANAALQHELGRLRNQLGSAQGRLATMSAEVRQHRDVEHKLAATEAASTSKADRIAQLTRALDKAQRDLHMTEAQRVTLVARLSKAEADLAHQETQSSQAQTLASETQRRLQQLQAERDRAAAERDSLKARLSQLQQKSSMARPSPAPGATPASIAAAPRPAPVRREAAATVAPPAPAARPAAVAMVAPPAAAARPPAIAAIAPRPAEARRAPQAATLVVPRRAEPGPVSRVERVLASAGVDVERLFSQFGVKRGLGGPFVPMPKGGLPPSELTPQKLEALRAMIKTLPIAVPMKHYVETSPFGPRRDPFNGRPAFHPGVDLAAPYDTPVYATGPGVVTFSGYRSDYGKIVEIDHGHGIVSRYGHLARCTVLVGQHVAAGDQIGYEGSTGRSTGPHVIYEIDVNGEPQDPAKFMALGHIVPVSMRR